jgi:DNA-3-methyladenine glycosylase II
VKFFLLGVTTQLGLIIKRYPFDVLVSSIISQQISAKAARTIKNRLLVISRDGNKFDSKKLLSLSKKEIRKTGFSRSKTEYIKKLLKLVSIGSLNFRKLCNEKDQIVINASIKQPGIGPWTAEMFLIFSLGRLDVLSIRDAGLRRAAKIIYGFKKDLTDEEFIKIGEYWKPYRSIATWYLWHIAD